MEPSPDLHTATDVYQHLQPDNDFERLAVQGRKKITDFKNRLLNLEEKEVTPEQRKVRALAQIIQTYREVDEPIDEEDQTEVRWVDRPLFDIVMSLVILCNSIAIGLEVDLGNTDHNKPRAAVWIVLESCFVFVFVFEVVVKVCYHSWKWMLISGWNIFTVFVALTAAVDACILGPLGLHGRLRMLSLIRTVAMLRLIKVIRNLKGLKELKLILQGLTGSLAMLVWTVVILVIFVYIGAVFATSAIGLSDDYNVYSKLTHGWSVDTYFGTVGRSMYTILQCITRDGWSSIIGRHVLEQQWYMAFFFVGFNMVATYGLLNLVISVIIEQTLTAARSNERRMQNREDRERKDEFEVLKQIFLMSDEDGSGAIDIAEFEAAVRMDHVRDRMRRLELPIDDAKKLFSTIDGDGYRSLSMGEFIEGCQKLKGAAKSRDLLAITAQADSLSRKINSLGEKLHDSERMLAAIDEISLRIMERFDPSVKNSQHKIAKAIAGSAPVKPMSPEKVSGIGVNLSHGNRPLLPELPSLLQ